jgi:hypothetical protein
MGSVERHQRRTARRRLRHEPSPDQRLDDGARVAGRDTGGDGELPPGHGLLQASELLEQCTSNADRDVEQRRAEVHGGNRSEMIWKAII